MDNDLVNSLPKHVAIIMDGNGRWAKQRNLPRVAGHRAGLDAARNIIQRSAELGIKVLSLFAFSSENWQRPAGEVKYLMQLFLNALNKEVKQLHENNIRISFIGERSRFNAALQRQITKAEQLTESNSGLHVVIAANYGGRWDLTQALQRIAQQVKQGELNITDINDDCVTKYLSHGLLPDPDLFIRTSGELRISNFYLWRLAYTELYFSDVYWPDFDTEQYQLALTNFAERRRRFGLIDEQVEQTEHA